MLTHYLKRGVFPNSCLLCAHISGTDNDLDTVITMALEVAEAIVYLLSLLVPKTSIS